MVLKISISKIYLGPTCPPNSFDKTIFDSSDLIISSSSSHLERFEYYSVSSRLVNFLCITNLLNNPPDSSHLPTKVTRVFNTTIYTPLQYSVHPITLESNQSVLENLDDRYLLSILKYHLDQSLGKIFHSYDQHSHSIDSLRCNHQPSFNTSSSHQIRNQPTWDPTTRLQAQCLRKSDDLAHLPLWKRADDCFFYNKFLQAGTHYFSRGIDLDGNVSNFNKTEMIFYANLNRNNNSLNHNQHQQHLPTSSTMANKLIMASFVQTRPKDHGRPSNCQYLEIK
ncbi:hypothetical protein PPACK8108_LOCUS17908 [Phakopsora pachyrhizi]|uniref:SAC domain-containing protein n=1 Tax=Phakopsora pachyrhizi TaxID=170000 RepID=A0AAV0BDP3_PHAPC|nr:hypothetical protein PPACK8108_LOCUS17908 [Phakopsora pachyrhizi]